jgi:hypothetical protein
MKIFYAGIFTLFLNAALASPPCLGQGFAANPAQTMSPSKVLNAFAYPCTGQSPKQQTKDEQGCYDAAEQQAVANTAAQQQKEEEQAKSEQSQKLDTFRFSFGACMGCLWLFHEIE